MIKFREPVTGKTFTRKFNPKDSIHILYDYVESKLDEIQFENRWLKFDIIQSIPFKVIVSKEIEVNGESRLNTLEDEGLFPTAMLQIKETFEDDEEDEEEDE